MLILPKGVAAQAAMDKHVQTRTHLIGHFNHLMEKVINENKHKDLYWILGKVKTARKDGKCLIRPFLQACDEKPGLVRESFVYQVDNRRGVKELLWVMHAGDTLSFPTLGKSIKVGGKAQTILTPN